MSYTAQLTLRLHSTQTKTPQYQVKLNNQVQNLNLLSDSQLIFNTVPVFGDNCLAIEFLNKDPADTVVDSNNNIIEDLAVEIVQFTIDDIDFTDWIKNNSIYTDTAGVQHNTFGFMHTNGTFTFDFVCPGFYFIRNLATKTDQNLGKVIRHDNY